jgi:hypothetical protein
MAMGACRPAITMRRAGAPAAVVAVLAIAAGCGAAGTAQTKVPSTAKLSLTQAAARLCGVGLRVSIAETSLIPNAPRLPSHAYSASPAIALPAIRVVATGTLPVAGTSVRMGSVVVLRVVAPAGTFAAIRLPASCRAPATTTGTSTAS